jgi:hypothetical protein
MVRHPYIDGMETQMRFLYGWTQNRGQQMSHDKDRDGSTPFDPAAQDLKQPQTYEEKLEAALIARSERDIYQTRRIDALEAAVAALSQEFADLRGGKSVQPDAPAPAGAMPPLAELDRLTCQIWHNPTRPKKSWTTYRLKFEGYRDDKKVREFYLNTYRADGFAEKYAKGYAGIGSDEGIP